MNKRDIKIRIEFWEAILVAFNKNVKDGKCYSNLVCICWCINMVRAEPKFYKFHLARTLKNHYPELLKYKPKSCWKQNTQYWWSPDKNKPQTKRVQVINNIINDLKKQL